MKRDGAEGLSAVYQVSPAANEEFTGMVNGVGRLARASRVGIRTKCGEPASRDPPL